MNRSSSLSNGLLRELKIFRNIRETESEYYDPKKIQKNLSKFESARNSDNLASTSSSSKKEPIYNLDSNNLASSPEKSGNDTFLEASFHPDTSKILLEKSNKSFHSENFTQLSNEFKKSQNSQFKSFEKLCVKYQDLYQKYVDNLKIIDNLKKQEMNVKNKEKIEHATSKSSLHKKETDLSKSKIENNKELCSELEKSKKTIAILKNEVSYYRNEAKKYQKESELLGEEVITIRTEYSKSKNDTERQRQGSHSNRLYETPIKIGSFQEKKLFDLVRDTLTKEDLRRELLSNSHM